MGLIIHVDGGARGNPGPAGAGVVIRSESGTLLHEAAYFLGEQTNNAAEYLALIRALQRALDFGDQPLCVCSDSQLLVRQITGAYRVKSSKLRVLFQQAQQLLLKVSCWKLQHVSRDDNRRADELANLAMDRRRDVLVHDVSREHLAPSGPGEPARGSGADHAATGSGPPRAAASQVGQPAPRAYAVRVVLAAPPDASHCPAAECALDSFTVRTTLPAALCLHAAHALLPTLLAMLNTDPQEFAALPTMTVRCVRGGCPATFHLSPVRSANGVPRRDADAAP